MCAQASSSVTAEFMEDWVNILELCSGYCPILLHLCRLNAREGDKFSGGTNNQRQLLEVSINKQFNLYLRKALLLSVNLPATMSGNVKRTFVSKYL